MSVIFIIKSYQWQWFEFCIFVCRCCVCEWGAFCSLVWNELICGPSGLRILSLLNEKSPCLLYVVFTLFMCLKLCVDFNLWVAIHD